MPNKKINALDVRVAVSTDLMLVGDPATGTAYKSTLATLPLVPTNRTLTINGVAFDLSANRAWTISSGTVTSVGLSMPSAFSVANSPITTSGTLAVTAIGTAAQYIRGDGQLATLPSGSSGGSAVAYYLNGSVAASVGTYFQMSKIAVLGAGTDFALAGNGLISQFLTDVADPNRLEIPAGNWNFEMYMSASSSGGTPAFYVELLKYNGTTFTSIASSSAIPEAITSGTIIDLYLTSLAIPQTTLLSTDRLAIRVYIVNSTGGRTITMHTENSHLCEIITNFAGGIAALNGLTANTQYLATGTSGTDFAISSLTDTHTFNLPTASATNRGALSSADWSTFNGKASGNIYTANGTLTGNRVVTMGAFTLSFEKDILVNGITVGKGNGSLSNNTAIGLNALGSASVGINNTAIGTQALQNNQGGGNVAIGYTALQANTTGGSNTAIGGFQTLSSNTTGTDNVAVGRGALASIVSTSGNVAIGNQAASASTGTNNTVIGANAFALNTTGQFNVAIGTTALRAAGAASNNVAIGWQALLANTGDGNTAIGLNTAFSQTSATNNVLIGGSALAWNVTGSNNIAIGRSAGLIIASSSNLTNASNSIFIGTDTKSNIDSQTNQIVIGHSATGLGSNTTTIGNASTITSAIRGRLILGTLSDTGLYQLDVNGTARVSGAGTFTTTDGTTVLSLNQSTVVTNSPLLNLNYNQTGGAGGGLLTIISSSSSRYLANFNNYTYIDGGGRFVIGVAAFYGTNVLTTNGDIRINSSATNSITSSSGGLSLLTGSATDGILVNFTTVTNNSGISVINTFSGGSGTGSCYTLDNRGNNRHLYFHNNTTNPTVLTNSGSLLLGTTTENTSALLNVTSTTKGFLPPRMTTTQINAIATPAEGLQIYNTTISHMCFYQAGAWVKISHSPM